MRPNVLRAPASIQISHKTPQPPSHHTLQIHHRLYTSIYEYTYYTHTYFIVHTIFWKKTRWVFLLVKLKFFRKHAAGYKTQTMDLFFFWSSHARCGVDLDTMIIWRVCTHKHKWFARVRSFAAAALVCVFFFLHMLMNNNAYMYRMYGHMGAGVCSVQCTLFHIWWWVDDSG